LLKKRLLAMLLALTLCFTTAGCLVKNEWEDWDYSAEDMAKPSQDPDDQGQASSVNPLLYKVTDSSGTVLWLFGSIHLGLPEFYPLPDYVLNAFDGADTLAVEVDIIAFNKDQEARTEAIRELRYKDGSVVTDHIPHDLHGKAKDLLKNANLYSEAMNNYMPALWSMYVDNASYQKVQVKSSYGVDRHMLNLAYEQNKPIYSIESGKFQYAMMASFSPELQQLLLEESVRKYTEGTADQTLTDLAHMWASGDVEKLTEVLEDDSIPTSSKALYEEYLNAMFVQRNKNMTQYAESALRSGKEVFICVGAGHIIGDYGIAQQLEDLGYTVEIVSK